MSDELQSQTPAEPAHANPAVAHCIHVWRSVYKTERARGESSYSAGSRASSAYRNAMPPLDGYSNIRDFIACVAQGVLLGAIEDRQSSKLLYAAQVALSAARLRQATPKPAATA
jgi:hypothetical protein